MSEIEFVKPTVEMVKSIADSMRQADINEVWASDNHTPLQALMDGWEQSDYSSIAAYEDHPLVMFGLVKRDLLSGVGIIWMLGSNDALKYRRNFLTLTPLVIDEMLTICSRLTNMVHCKNRESVRWLKWLGFTLDDPVPFGVEKELFHNFYIDRS